MLRMIHAVVDHLSGMILLHQFYHYLRVASIQKRGIKHCEEHQAFIVYHHIAVHGRKQKESAIFSIAMGTILR